MNFPRLRLYFKLMRWDKPVGFFLLLWPTSWALWIAAKGIPPWRIVFIFILGVFLMRSAGCVVNDFVDRHHDPYVARTKNRPLALGEIANFEAIALFVFLVSAAFLCVLFLNRFTIILSGIALFLTVLYPFLKRMFSLPQLGLGFAFSFGIPMAFSAVTDTIPLTSWILYSAVLSWTIAYDTEYAMVDRDDDLRAGIKSSAILLGSNDRLAILSLQLVMLILLILTGILNHFKTYYYLSLCAASMLMAYQHKLLLNREPEGCFRAFLNNQWIGLIIFIGIGLSYL